MSEPLDVLAAQVRAGIDVNHQHGAAVQFRADEALAALVARVTKTEQRLATAGQNASLSMGREVGSQHRAESAEAALAAARNALEGVEERTHWNYACTASEAMTLMRGYIREVLARLDGSSE